MNEEELILDFAHRCMRAQEILHKVIKTDISPRVWSCVMMDVIKQMCEGSSNPEAAKQQIIDILYRKDT